MAVGIGAGGAVGVGLEVLPPPVQTTPATATTGGSILAGTYRLAVTALNAQGETTISNELTQVTTGSASTITVNWTAVTGATGYKIYRSAAGGGAGTELFVAQVGVVVTYVDTGTPTPAGAIPTVNTATRQGVYVLPSKFIPIDSESLQYQQATVWRRPIRKTAEILGGIAGNANVAGDLVLDATEDVVLYFLIAARTACVKTGTSPNFTYTFTPTALATPVKTLSIAVERNGMAFGYVGCIVSSISFRIEDGALKLTASIVGNDEAAQSALTGIVWPTVQPFGMGQYSIEIPTGTPVLDTDSFEFGVEDNAEPQFRLKNTGQGAQFVAFGERSTTLSVERDFEARTEYDAFKTLTSKSVSMKAIRGVNNSIQIDTPAAIVDTYELGLSGQGDLIRGAVKYNGVVDGTGKSYQIIVKTQEDIPI